MLILLRGREVGNHRLGDGPLRILFYFLRKFRNQHIPLGFVKGTLAFYHQRYLILEIDHAVTVFLGIGIDMVRKTLTDEQPNHVGRKHERTMAGVGLIHPIEKRMISVLENQSVSVHIHG